jgi:hypothetical protein
LLGANYVRLVIGGVAEPVEALNGLSQDLQEQLSI